MTALLLIIALLPQPNIVIDRMDSAEVNHVHYRHTGKPIFTQIIFREVDEETNCEEIQAWRIWRRRGMPSCGGTDYVAVWMDGDMLRCVHVGQIDETWTLYDPEVAERKIYPKRKRRELYDPAIRKPIRGRSRKGDP